MDRVPGIGSMTGDLASSHASDKAACVTPRQGNLLYLLCLQAAFAA